MTHCEKCNVEVFESSIKFINNKFVCLNCEDDMTVKLQDKIDDLMTEFEEFHTGGGCLAMTRAVVLDGLLHTVVVTDCDGTDAPTVENGLMVGLYKGDWMCNEEQPLDVQDCNWINDIYKDNISEGLNRIKQLLDIDKQQGSKK